MVRWGMAVVAVLAAGPGCGGSATTEWKCAAEQAQFSRASISVDPNKRMSDLTADERASVCAEFSRAVTASFGSVEYLCRGLSHDPATQGTAACQSAYADCLQTQAPETMMYCTEKMSGMWDCPMTIGQYQDCFNDGTSVMYALIFKQPVCGALDENICGAVSQPASCAVTRCDYTWYD